VTASGGTLFLDEVGELPLPLQVKLLRALQEKTVTKVGDTKPERVDIRVVAATNRDLEKEIQQGNFREDLFYRLNVVNLHLPPLCERGEDVVVIAKFLLEKFAREFDVNVKGFTPNAIIAMKKYDWPGNVRQLENRLKKAIVLCDRTLVGPEDLDLFPEALEEVVPLAEAREEFTRRYVLEILERNDGNRTKTARDLGVDPRTVFRYLEREPDSAEPSGLSEA
jgi:transcriptional regulator with PAS, ATPase and Fis domain